MAITVKHTKVSTIPDGDDSSLIRPSDWNADHQLVGTVPVANGGTGASTANNGLNALLPTQTGNTGKVLTTDGTNASWSTNGVGDVIGPASATDNAITRFDGTTGKLIQNSSVTITDAGDVAGAGSLTFDGTIAPAPVPGTLWFDSSTDTLNLQQNAITQQIGEELFIYGKASAAITDSPLQIIYHTGTVGASGVIKFAPTVAGITDVNAIIGVATEAIPLNGFGRITSFGVVHGINTSGSAVGETWHDDDVIWYNPLTGNPTNVKPVAPNMKIQVGLVINAGSGGSGSFQVLLQSGTQLGGTDSNVQITSPSNGNILTYDGGNGYWKNTDLSAGTGISVSKSANGVLTVTNTSPSSGGTVTSITAGTGLTGGTITSSGTIAIDSTVSTLTGIQTLTNKTISGASNTLTNIGNSSLTNSAITINGTSTSLGGSVSVGTVTSVTGTAPVSVATGTTTPVISMAAANTTTNGYLTSTDWNTFNNKQPAGAYLTTVTADAPLTGSGTSASHLSIPAATGSVNGYLTSTDWTTFNGKQAALVSGTNIKTVNGTSLLGSGDVGTISVSYGGTGLTTLTAGYIPYGNGTGAFNSSSTFVFDGANLGIGTNAPAALLDVNGISKVGYFNKQSVTLGITAAQLGAGNFGVLTLPTTTGYGGIVRLYTQRTANDSTGANRVLAEFKISRSGPTTGANAVFYVTSAQVDANNVTYQWYFDTTTGVAALKFAQTGNSFTFYAEFESDITSAVSVALTTTTPAGTAIYPTYTQTSTSTSSGYFLNVGSVTNAFGVNILGNALVGLSSANANGGILQLAGGITFPASQVAATDPNTLDDYEEGTFTPTISGTTTAGTGTYTVQAGFYTKIGNRVLFNLRVAISAHTGTGNMLITSLPFTSSNTANDQSPPSFRVSNLTLTASNVVTGIVGQNSTSITIEQYPAGGGAITSVAMDTACDFIVSGHYFV